MPFLMNLQLKNMKKIIAKEFLLLLLSILLVVIVWVVIIVSNNFHEKQILSSTKRQNELFIKIKNSPKDRIALLYDGIRENLTLNYSVEGKKYRIPIKHQKTFLSDYPSANIKNGSTNGYVCSESTRVDDYGIPILECEFDYVNLKRFSELLKDSTYKMKFFYRFSKDYDLGTYESFLSKISISQNVTIDNQRNIKNLLKEKQNISASIIKSMNSIFSDEEISRILFTLSIVILIIIYPIRILFKVTIWSVKAIKEN